ncbi:MAG: hypothetical protein ABW321_05340 [Polyangiales bacterium]
MWLLRSAPAQAETTIAADLDLQVPVSVNGVGTGAGFGIRLGQELRLPLFSLNPEIGFTYASFSKDEPPKVYRGIAGVRLGFGELIRFGVLAHVGFGYVSWSPRLDGSVVDLSHSGFTYDVGVFIEFIALPLLNIGVHGIYNRIAETDRQEDTLHWLQFGVHVTLVL